MQGTAAGAPMLLRVTERISVIPYRRSVFQVALLMFVTGGLYVFVWSYFMRRACASFLEQEDQPVWKSVALIVPIFGFFMMFDLAKKIQGVQWRANPARVDGSLPWVGLSMFVFTVVGHSKGNAGYLGIFVFAPIALMQHRFLRAQIALLGEAAIPTRLRWPERAVIILGGGLWAWTIVDAVTGAPSMHFIPGERAWLLGCMGVAIAALVLLLVTSRRTVAEGLAAYADPSRDRIAPYG
jgi:hypothetical protein